MSNQHITAALGCRKFKGNTRMLLFILADAAYSKKTSEAEEEHVFGWCTRSVPRLMHEMNANRRHTVETALKELVDAKVIVRQRRRNLSCRTFVDLDWLLANQDRPKSPTSKSDPPNQDRPEIQHQDRPLFESGSREKRYAGSRENRHPNPSVPHTEPVLYPTAAQGNEHESFSNDFWLPHVDSWHLAEPKPPQPFIITICPYCKGQGYVYVDEDNRSKGVRPCQCRQRGRAAAAGA